MQTFNKEQVGWLKERCKKGDISFMFIASPYLLEIITNEQHPYVKSLHKAFKIGFLEKRPVSITSKMVIDFIENKLDQKNHFILSNGEIRVVEDSKVITKGEK